jgi:two-component system OmpR family response regulator
MNMLIVDDESEICLLLQAILMRKGVTSVSAHTLAEARTRLRSNRFDGVFLDVNLPDGRGYDLIPDLRRHHPAIRVIAISAMDDERARALDAGADLFLSKPLDLRTILGSLSATGILI